MRKNISMTKSLIVTAAVAVCSLVAQTSSAAEEYGTLTGHRAALEAPRMYVAPKFGLVVPIDMGDEDAGFVAGIEAGFPIADNATLALNILRDYDDTFPIMGKLFMHAQAGQGLHYGLQAGIIHNPKADSNDFGAGLVLGYDQRITPMISVGLEAEHVTAFADDMYHLIHFVVPVKVHF